MNERIKQLAEQAGFSFKYKTAPDELNPGHKLQDLQKFAELIVKECCDVLQNEDIRHSGYGYNQGFLHKKIKEHFGVQE